MTVKILVNYGGYLNSGHTVVSFTSTSSYLIPLSPVFLWDSAGADRVGTYSFTRGGGFY